MAQDVSAIDRASLVGTKNRVGCYGLEYEVVDLIDDQRALVHIQKWDEKIPYRIADIRKDAAGITGASRFAELVGQVRSIGPDGPKYEVISVDDKGGARIWIIPEDDNEDYWVMDILLDPDAD